MPPIGVKGDCRLSFIPVVGISLSLSLSLLVPFLVSQILFNCFQNVTDVYVPRCCQIVCIINKHLQRGSSVTHTVKIY